MKKILIALTLCLAFGSAIFAAGASSPITGFSWDNVRKVVRFMTSDGNEITVDQTWKQYTTSVYDTTPGNCTTTGTVLKICGLNLTAISGNFMPYRTADGAWRLRFNFRATRSDAFLSPVIYFNGVLTGPNNYYCGAANGNAAPAGVEVGNNSNTISISQPTTTTYAFGSSCDIALGAKPAWAD